MEGRHWLERCERELRRRRLPECEIARLITELNDHLLDAAAERNSARHPSVSPHAVLKEEPMSASLAPLESLGSPGDVADAAIREFRNRRNLLARSRWAAFGLFVVAPLPLLVLAWAGVLLALVQIGELLSFTGDAQQGPRDYTPAHVLAGNVALLILVLAPSAGLAIVYGRIARRTARQWLWGLSACAIVALATSVATTSITFSEIPGKSTMTFGLGVGAFRWAQLWQFAVPFAAGWLSLHRTAARRPAEAI